MKLEKVHSITPDGTMVVEYSLSEDDVRTMLKTGDPEAVAFVNKIMEEELTKRFPDGSGFIRFAGYIWGKLKLTRK